MIKFRLIFIAFILQTFLYGNVELDLTKLTNYKTIKEFYSKTNNKYLFFRSFTLTKENYFLALNLNSLKTFIINEKEIENFKKETKKISDATNYNKLQKEALKNSNFLSNSGINKNLKQKKDEFVYLTIDMCPSSKKGFEKDFFNNLENRYKKNIPISIAITYKWVKAHKSEFEWLLKNKKYFDITWINHSKTHYYNSKEKNLSKNFMLHNIKDFEKEILDLEKMLILNNQTPSILFRFPGLISNSDLIKKLINKYSLIPLGTSNWLAKREKNIESGDIILVHGNLNEHIGIELFNSNISNFKLASVLNGLKIKE